MTRGTSTTPFTHGVASFDPTTDGVLLWARVDGERAVRWHVSRDPDATEVVAEGTASVSDDADGCVTVDVTGLEPGTSYHYWFTAHGVLSPIGRTRTLPDGPTEWARIALACCADPSFGPLRAYRAVAEDEVDLVVHLGDYVYEEAKGDLPVPPEHVCATLDDYRQRYAATRRSPDLQALHLRHPMVFVWDDHDVADNAWRHGAKEHDPEEHGPWEQRLAAAAQARQEWVPARLRDPDDLLSMWRSLPLGDLAEVVVLDTRIPGRDEQAGDSPEAKDLFAEDRSLLGEEQRAWAHERLHDRTRPWSLLATAVTLGPLTLPVPAGSMVDPLLPGGYAIVDGVARCTDEWDGYPAERDRLLDVARERGGGTVALSGDVHSSWALELRDHDGQLVGVEVVAPSVSSTPMAEQLPSGWERLAEQVGQQVEGQRWRDLLHRGYVRLDVRPDRLRADWFAVDLEDETATPRLLASWAVTPELGATWQQATPSTPMAATRDEVRRPGLPIQDLPAPDPVPAVGRTRGFQKVLRLLAALAVLGVAAGAIEALRRRRA
jgi:alkaline phosphatase D